ncbi:MAG: hypothetical protein GY841_08200 [FCB group bacterium]|nr:hypothetical protein [FCB group bacterium]
MPEVSRLTEAELAFIYTEIGRGHPSYLDGIIEEMEQNYPRLSYYRTDVFKLSKGLSLGAWKLVEWLYRFGSSGGLITGFYSCLRRFTGAGQGGGKAMIGILGRNIKRELGSFDRPIVVAHPLLARMLSAQNRVVYQHGEMAAPSEAMVTGCTKILVPFKETAGVFERSGVSSESVTVTGQCIESALAQKSGLVYRRRLDRLAGKEPLTVGLFTSGACPARHLSKLHLMARALFQAGYMVYVFFDRAYQVCDKIAADFRRSGLPVKRNVDEPGRLKLLTAADRREGNQQVAALFDRFDLFVAPAHERTNWAVGLGLPMLILCPHIGSYATQNADLALDQKTAFEIPDNESAARVPELIDRLRRSGELQKMARRGFGHTKIQGFASSARILSRLN